VALGFKTLFLALRGRSSAKLHVGFL
jgi:hypothetical protein